MHDGCHVSSDRIFYSDSKKVYVLPFVCPSVRLSIFRFAYLFFVMLMQNCVSFYSYEVIMTCNTQFKSSCRVPQSNCDFFLKILFYIVSNGDEIILIVSHPTDLIRSLMAILHWKDIEVVSAIIC